MKKLVRKNQIIITALALMIAAAGYFNYAEKNIIKSTGVAGKDVKEDESVAAGIEDPYKDDDLLLSDNDILSLDSDSEESTTAPSGEEQESDSPVDAGNEAETKEQSTQEPGEAVLTSGKAFSADAKLNREQLRAKNKEALMEIINNASVSEAQKQQAVDAMVAMTNNSEKEEAVEMLLEAKGFGDTVVSISDTSVDIVMDMSNISDAQRAQIEDIVMRKAGATADNIVFTPLN